MKLCRENSKTDGKGRKNTKKVSWVEIRRGRGHSHITAMDKTVPAWGNWLNLLSIK